MSNTNKPDWNDLQNEQAETNAWQIDKIWTTAKKLPVYFWVLSILLTATMLNTLRLHYVMQDIKTEVSAGLNTEIAELKSAKKAMRSRVLESQKSVNTLVDRLATAEAQRDEYHDDAHALYDKRQRERKLLQESQALAKSLQQQIADNRHGYLMARETSLICIGVAKDDAEKLKLAEKYQVLRTGEPFSILRWKNADVFATSIIALNARHCANWVISQKNWEQSIDSDLHDFLIGLSAELTKQKRLY
jgi:hypothetical protein